MRHQNLIVPPFFDQSTGSIGAVLRLYMKNTFKAFVYFKLVAVSFFILATITVFGAEDNKGLRLAINLSEEQRHTEASVEYRRLAFESSNKDERSAYWWMAAYELWKDGRYGVVPRLLDSAEDESSCCFNVTMLLRGENAFAEKKYDEADFYFSGIEGDGISDDAVLYIARRRAASAFLSGDTDSASAFLSKSAEANADGISAIARYTKGRDKKPMVGGLLGIVPGLGYVYAGEYANGVRSLLLNSLFIYGMIETADQDLWGVFGVISFFELTWYTGSIYGGIDASHRYNADRRNECLDAINNRSAFSPDLWELPLVVLRFSF